MIENEIVNIISTIGFPIVAFLLMFYQSTKTINKNTTAIKELADAIMKMR